MAVQYYEGIGRRKESTARVRMMNGSGKFIVNDRPAEEYFPRTGDLQLISRSQDGTLGDGASHGASISDDGRFIAFRSAAGNLVADDGNGDGFDIFVKDVETGALQRFEVLDDGGGNWSLLEPSLSGDGQFVAYTDQVTSAGDGSLTGGQVVVAPIDSLVVSPPAEVV